MFHIVLAVMLLVPLSVMGYLFIRLEIQLRAEDAQLCHKNESLFRDLITLEIGRFRREVIPSVRSLYR